jgi:hypothetical protein
MTYRFFTSLLAAQSEPTMSALKASEAHEADAALAKLVAKGVYLQLSTFQFLFHTYQYRSVIFFSKFQSWF